MIKILVDTLGGDNSPSANVEGAVKALSSIEDLEVVLVGDEKVISEQLKNFTFDASRLSIVHAPDEISCNDKPTEAIKTKKESSLYKCYEILRTDETVHGMVSTGSTGAILAGAVLRLGRIKGIKRPAFCPILPTMKGSLVGICDSGANVDCDSVQLTQFAVMADLYLKKAYGVESPKVALLNVGVEEEKGDLLRKETFAALKANDKINFVGNMEGRDLLSGNYDLVVCDGFTGNVLLKSTEGACLEMLKMLKKTFMKNLKNRIAAGILKKDVYALKDFMDYNNYGGAVLLGANKTVVKGHGSSKAVSVFHCIEQAYNMEKENLREAISQAVAQAE
ncbi:MAG: phosphate acyltransferase PlsX [Candidatus Borkfalkiaceae bacterium]|nr:phosphate acyltransferase PlsX [Christensenellaceae bacterium]